MLSLDTFRPKMKTKNIYLVSFLRFSHKRIDKKLEQFQDFFQTNLESHFYPTENSTKKMQTNIFLKSCITTATTKNI